MYKYAFLQSISEPHILKSKLNVLFTNFGRKIKFTLMCLVIVNMLSNILHYCNWTYTNVNIIISNQFINEHLYSEKKFDILIVQTKFTPTHLSWIGKSWGKPKIFEKCQFTNCVVQNNMSLFDAVDAILFEIRSLRKTFKRRKVGQRSCFQNP